MVIISVELLSRVWLFATPWIAARQASLSITNSRSSPKLMSIELVMPSSHLSLCRPLLLLPPIPPSIRVFFSDDSSGFLLLKWWKRWYPKPLLNHESVQFSSVAQLCPTLCDPMNCSTPGFPVHHQLQGFTETHVHWVSDAIQPSHPLSSPFPPALNLSQHQGLFQWVSSLHQVAKVLGFQLQHQSCQWIFRTDFL